MRHFKHDQPMESPVGCKLRELGCASLWDYLERFGFTDLPTFTERIDFPTLVPIGFLDFLLASADTDRNWPIAYRVATACFLNDARIQYAESAPSPDWMIIQPAGLLASTFGDEVNWGQRLAFKIRDHLLARRGLFDSQFGYDDHWLVELVAASAD